VARRPEVTRVVDQATFRDLFGGTDAFYKRFPDYIAAAADKGRVKG
jgi:hypothetical protein